jgi:DNA-binding MarR family transcriptional regulator
MKMRKDCFSAHLTPAEVAAWGGMLTAHQAVVDLLDRELREAEGLSISEYEVLLHVAHAGDGCAKMGELAGSLPLTPSGVTRVVDRLEAAKLVRRARSTLDARSLSVTLTAAGRKRFERAHEVHMAGVRRHFLAPLSAEEVASLGAIWEKLRAAAGSAAGRER